MDKTIEKNAKDREKAEILAAVVRFREKYMGASPTTAYHKQMGDDHYELAKLYRDLGLMQSAKHAARESIRHYREVCNEKETKDALWDLDWSWIILRDLYRSTSETDLAIEAAQESVLLFLRLIRLGDSSSYYTNYQISTNILIELLKKKGESYYRKALDWCDKCLDELKFWPEKHDSGVRLCYTAGMYRTRSELCESLVSADPKHKNFWQSEKVGAIEKATALYTRAWEENPKSVSVAEKVSDAFNDWRLMYKNAANEKWRLYTRIEYECYMLLFENDTLKYARNTYVIAWLYAECYKSRLSEEEKRALCEKLVYELKRIHFYAGDKHVQALHMMRCCYYAAQVYGVFFSDDLESRHAMYLQACDYGSLYLVEKGADTNMSYYLDCIDGVFACDIMPADERPAFIQKISSDLSLLHTKITLRSQVDDLRKKLERFRPSACLAYFDPQD